MAADIEAEFEMRLTEFGRECCTCVRFVYSEIAFHFWASSEPEIVDRVRPLAGFWNPVLAGLQAGGFVALGRLYDDGRDVWSARKFLDLADQREGLFRRGPLRQRKIRGGLNTDAAAAFAADAYEVRSGGFGHLRAAFNLALDDYVRLVEPIRHTVFAHAGARPLEGRSNLFAGLMVRDVERLAMVPLQIHDAIWEAFHNGREPTIRAAETNGALIARAVARGDQSSGEQFHAVRQVHDFLEWLRRAPLDE